ncbi:DUF6471 domain-containing protein [Lentzea sp. NBRC 105346]|uniref:DUF6471 domain-containing protein n=1 Tax=Lentzea sp. NBRC 105346 TaxID=3032205 RepID=UPI0025550ABF|nr:DUF6471 domain-containing protein [Lentzea sp. NBRC 105346]
MTVLKEEMARKRLTQKDLVERLKAVGIETSKATICRSLKGERKFAETELRAIRDILDMKPVPKQPAPRSYKGIAIVATLVALSAIAILVVVLVREPDSTGEPTPQATPAPQGRCDKYEIAAKDLWLRDEHTNPVTQLPRGLKLTVKNRETRQWQVETEDNRSGWVDPGYLKPIC